MPWAITNFVIFADVELNSHMKPVPEYYFSKSEWDRLGCGPLPPERDRENPENQKKIRQSLENMQSWLDNHGTGQVS